MNHTQSLTHVYFMPGMSANPNIFEHISLPEDQYVMHWLYWIPPDKNESIRSYAQRISTMVKHENVVLVGVSLGGIVVQEMQAFVKVKQLVLISTIKTKYELPRLMRFGKKSWLYRVLPMRLAKHYKLLHKLPLSRKIKHRLDLYDKYIGVYDAPYLKWGIKKVLFWDRETPLPNLIHIHGDADKMFPIEYIKDCIVVPGGTHIMIINRFKWFNKHLPELLHKAIG